MKQEHSQLWFEVKNYVLILIGSAIVAVGFNTLLLPNQIAAGGVSGISTIMQSFGFEAAYVQWGLNIPLFIAGFYLLGGTFGVKRSLVLSFTFNGVLNKTHCSCHP